MVFVLKPEEGKGAKEIVEDIGLRGADDWSNERAHRRTDFGVLCVEVHRKGGIGDAELEWMEVGGFS